MIRIPYEKMYSEFLRVLLKKGFTKERAELCARLFSETSRDGVYTHGLNRFPRFIGYIDRGELDIHAKPELVETVGMMERWDGNLGPGNLNAYFCMDRAIQIARKNGMGCVALRNSHHWMRPGAYGLQAADAGCIGMCWTNTVPNMPPWGGKECKLGNNPIVLAVPREGGHVVLDTAVSMFSYGKLESYSRSGEPLPVDGGYDKDGNVSRDAAAILEAQAPLPIGYWKGSGLSLLMDLIVTVLSAGNSSYEIGKLPSEGSISQLFIAIDITKFSGQEFIKKAVNDVINDLHDTTPIKPGGKVMYPGERVMATRKENLEKGIPVDEFYWNQVLEM